MALTGNGLGVIEGLALHAGGVALVGFDDGQLVAAVAHIHHAGNAGGEVGGVVLISTGGQRSLKAVTGEEVAVHELGNRIGLVAVGDHGGLPQGQHGVIDDEVRVFQLGGVSGHRADAALDRLKHAVAAVGAAAHDPVGHHGLFAVGGQAQHNAAAGILVAS